MVQRPAPPVFPVFRSRLAVAVLVQVYVGGGEYSVGELAEAAGTDSGNMTREVARLEQAGVLSSRRVGRTKLVQANKSAPFFNALRELVIITLGPKHVLEEELAGLEGVERAAVFGSWAARMAGEPGSSPVDIDLLVIGRPNRDDLYDAAARAQRRLGREVNPVVVAPDRWESTGDGFLAELKSRPLVYLDLAEDDR